MNTQQQINQTAIQKLIDLIYLSLPNDYDADGLMNFIDLIHEPKGNSIYIKSDNGASDLMITVSVAE